MENLIRQVLKEIGEDPDREGLLKTPHRVAKAYDFLCAGYKQDAGEIIKGAIFEEEEHEEMIVVRDIELYSLCEHHMLPFFGKAHVAYLPKKRILGLSEFARVVEVFARRLQVQERLTTQIASTLQEHLDPWGVGVVVEAQHLCMQMRGIQKQNSCALTSSMLGVFRTDRATREEFMNLIFHRRS